MNCAELCKQEAKEHKLIDGGAIQVNGLL